VTEVVKCSPDSKGRFLGIIIYFILRRDEKETTEVVG
jgi:hypothetical protein